MHLKWTHKQLVTVFAFLSLVVACQINDRRQKGQDSSVKVGEQGESEDRKNQNEVSEFVQTKFVPAPAEKTQDKTIFEDDYSLFSRWTDKLDDDNKKYYSERLISNLPLIPVIQEELYNKGEYTYDYSSLVVTMIGEFVCISNYSKDKIDKLQKVLINLGIVDSEIRTKKGSGDSDTVYTLVYSSKQPPKK